MLTQSDETADRGAGHQRQDRLVRTLRVFATASFVTYFAFLELSIAYEAEPVGINTGAGAHVESIVPGTVAEAAGFAVGDRVVSMRGLPITDTYDMSIALANVPLGTPIDWEIERHSRVLGLTTGPIGRRWVPINAPTNIAFVGFGLAVAFGLLLLWRGPPGTPTLLGALALLSLGCANLPLFPKSFLALWRDLPGPVEALLWPAAVSTLYSPLFMFAFCWSVTGQLARAQVAAMVPAALLITSVVYTIVLAAYSPARAMQFELPEWMLVGAPLVTPAYNFLGLVPLVKSARAATDVNDRRRAQTLIAGLAVGGTGILLFALMLSLKFFGVAEDASMPLWLWLAVALFSFLPASFAYATLRQRLFDLRIIIRLGLQYALARGAIVGIIPILMLIAFGDAVSQSDQTLRSILAARAWTYSFIAAGVAWIYFKREDWMRALDRRFFREHYAAQQILKDIVDDIGKARDFDQASLKVVSRIDSALHPVMTAVMTRPVTETAFTVTAKRPDTTKVTSLLSATAITQVVRVLGRPVVFGPKGLRDVPPDQLQWLTESNVEVVVPIATGATSFEAMLVLGPRRSEEPYSREDLDLLATIAASLALLIGRPAATGATTLVTTLATPASARRLANRYRIEKPIGEGGMGMVFAAVDETLERRVAVKVIKDQLHHGEGIARFQREARMAASLSHPHIVTVHDFGIDEMGSPYLVMELLEGRSLRAAIKADGRMSMSGALPILGGLASAIDAAHAKGVIHRDLKPENVFLTTDSSAKILDYGIAKPLTSATTFSTPGVGMGTLGYMAPEQASGGDAAPAWDVWALTVIAFEMLTGQHPFGGGLPVRQATPIKTLAPDLPDHVADAIDAALSLTPSERPGTATGLLRSFKAR